ncbi:MAG: ABC transporter ATP-binding protein/permease [Spirochaetaceae bacterium]|jgi:ATP-binding cassette subfamily B protein|nr:ABC transporter ATP-binding protein/permease [Spirochaetaceae bacterium]
MENKEVHLKVFKSLKDYFYRYRFQYAWGIFFLIVVDLAQMLIPQFTRRAINLISLGSFELNEIIVLGLYALGTMALVSAGRFLWRYFLHGASRHIETELRDKFFGHLLTLSYDFYQKNKIGDLMARAINDLGAVRQALGMGLVTICDSLVMTIAILLIIFVQDASTAIWAVLPLPIVTLLILLFGKLVGKRFFRVQETYSEMSDVAQETFAGIRVVKSFVKEAWFVKKFADTNEDYKAANMVLAKIFSFFFPFVTFLSGLTSIILLLVGGKKVLDGQMLAGDLVALFTYLQMLIWPLMGAGFMVNMIQRGAVSLTRINEVLETKPSIISRKEEVGSRKVVVSNDDAVRVEHLSFTYPGNEKKVLDDVSFSVQRGTMLGILGKTGSGKSTLIKTLTRMVDPPVGTVFVNGIDVHEYSLAALRGCFGVTPQDSYLFSDSIRDNIAYGIDQSLKNTPQYNEKVQEAARISAIDQDLTAFHEGWDTVIGEKGLTLSGGQKQRIAMSRALLIKPEILILDDSLSAVDAETERHILDALFTELKGRTAIVISHRVSTLRHAAQVLVLENGRIAEYGSPDELIKQNGFYAKTAALQQLEGKNG